MAKYDYKRLSGDIKKHLGYETSASDFCRSNGLKNTTLSRLIQHKDGNDYKLLTVLKVVKGLGKTLNDYVEN